MITKNTTKGLRFATLIRVSTEKQEQQGESLATQTTQLTADVPSLFGKLVAKYGGQEHATEGWERAELDRLLHDATQGKFDAVMIARLDRWSRDNLKSETGLAILRDHGIRFFVRTQEFDLYDENDKFQLTLNAAMGALTAAKGTRTSMDSRIHRARRGIPTCGKLPFGRTWDDKAKKWGIDPAKQELIQDVARRYLKGEAVLDLAREYGMNHGWLHKVLTARCGPVWVQTFKSPALKINESIPTPVPPLLDDDTRAAIAKRIEESKTFHRGPAKYRYLLGQFAFCATCGGALNGATRKQGKCQVSHYRHRQAKYLTAKPCSDRADWINARDLEEAVFGWLCAAFGNAAAVARAIDDAVPNGDQLDDLRRQRDRLVQAQKKTTAGIDRVVALIAKGTLDEADAERELAKLKAQQAQHAAAVAKLDDQLARAPDPAEVQRRAKQVAQRFQQTDPASMTWEEKRALCELVFSGRGADGKRLGVYVQPSPAVPKKRHRRRDFQIVGQFLQWHAVAPVEAESELDPECEEVLWADGKRSAELVKKAGKTGAKRRAVQSALSRPSGLNCATQPVILPFVLGGNTTPPPPSKWRRKKAGTS